MQRIAVIAGVLHSGGKRNLIMEYYRHIDRTKVQFDFICDSDSNGIPEEEIRFLGGRVYKVAPYKDIIPHLKETYKILKENQYEVMHAFDNTLNIFPMFLGCIAGVKVRISESISKGDKNEKKTLIKYILRAFSHWFTNCYMANSIDCGIWQFGKKTYDRGKVNIFKTVIDANAILVMIGFGELVYEMHDRIERYGVTNKVVDLGRRDDIKQFYNAFDAFLLPSLYEGMPVVGIEAQCSGLPIFFSKNITEETTASELAYYIGLEETPNIWANKIVKVVNGHIHKRRSYVAEVIKNGFDSSNEALRLQNFYLAKINQVDDITGKGK